MTVTARRGTARVGGSYAPDLDALLVAASTRRSRPLVALTRSIGAIDPISLFAAARRHGLEAALWLQPAARRSIVGIGRAWAFEGGGPDRFTAATAAWRSVLADAVVSERPSGRPDAGPVLLGGLGFTGEMPHEGDPWASFGPASLVLPTFTLVQRGTDATLAVAIAPDRLADPDAREVEQAWNALVVDIHAEDAVPAGRLRIVEELPDRPSWERTVGMFAGAVGRGRIDKVVLARRVTFEAASDLDVVGALRDLAATAPESTTYAFGRGDTVFMGATPERLARTSGRSFETVAIAGSAPRGTTPAEDAGLAAILLASEKDREEHAVVVETLRAGLVPLVDRLDVAETPGILPLRHLQHLVTPMTGTLHEEAGLLALAGVLHPTPAVGGAPRDVALDLIAEHEGFDRGWYAGPIGWLGADGDGELMVALRGGIVSGRDAVLFAGCGIVADSDPAREWEESRLKLRTMIAALGGAQEDAP